MKNITSNVVQRFVKNCTHGNHDFTHRSLKDTLYGNIICVGAGKTKMRMESESITADYAVSMYVNDLTKDWVTQTNYVRRNIQGL